MRIHFVGVKGTGMSALAQISTKMENADITGSDVSESFFTDILLEKAGITVLPFSSENISGVDLVVASAAYGKDHPEITAAISHNIPVLSYPEYLGRLMSKRRGVNISGTHGKTTTTALVGSILLDAGLDPTIVVGSNVPSLGSNAYAGTGEFFVAESCEYRRHFLNYNPEYLAILNMELDHPDYFRDLDDVINAFQELANKVPSHGRIIICGDDANWQRISSNAPVITYGLQKHNHYRAENISFDQGNTTFELMYKGESLGNFQLAVTGRHNVLNSLAAIALSRELGAGLESIRKTLSQFRGTKRRFEKLGEYNGALIMDDYAHHPTEVNATLEGARLAFPQRRIIAVFQPHTFTRTQKLLDDFAKSFSFADEVVVANIFSSAREKEGSGVNSETLANKLRSNGVNAVFMPSFQDIKSYLSEHLTKDHLVLTMGAGDIYKVGLDLVG